MNKHLLVIYSFLLLFLASCNNNTSDQVILVTQDSVKYVGDLTLSLNSSPSLNLWESGSIVVFRVDGQVKGKTGKKNTAYRIKENGSLEHIGKIDPSLTDEEIITKYGVENKDKVFSVPLPQ